MSSESKLIYGVLAAITLIIIVLSAVNMIGSRPRPGKVRTIVKIEEKAVDELDESRESREEPQTDDIKLLRPQSANVTAAKSTDLNPEM